MEAADPAHPGDRDALRRLETAYERAGEDAEDQLIGVLEKHAQAAATPAEKVPLLHRLAALYERQIAWMSEIRLGDGDPVVRACITSFHTNESDIEWVVGEMTRLAFQDAEVKA